jgi:spermidine/putrescine transport system permease protein
MTTRNGLTGLAVGLYLLLFFAYLFGPLVIMSITAFNSSSFPRV